MKDLTIFCFTMQTLYPGNFFSARPGPKCSHQIARLFDYQYLWKQFIYIIDFLHGDIHQKKVASEDYFFF